MNTVVDPKFRVVLDKRGSSPDPQTAIWIGQHQCVIDGFAYDDEPPPPDRCGEIIVKHQLEGDRGHYSVLTKAFIKVGCSGFPHSVVAQITRHQDTNFLVQSGRYTGDRFVKVAEGELDPEEVFYWRPVGKHASREGIYSRTEEMNERRRLLAIEACKVYAYEISQGVPFEDVRGTLPYDYRQDFDMSGTLESCWHWLDQRSKADSQEEIRILAEMVMKILDTWSPELSAWYRKNRWGKAKLAP